MYVCMYNWFIWNTYLQVLKDSKLPLQMVQNSDKPTRRVQVRNGSHFFYYFTDFTTSCTDFTTLPRVQVTRNANGDRAFAGFEGGASSDSFADCDVAVSKISGTWLYAADYLGQSSQMSVHSAFIYTKRKINVYFIYCTLLTS